jgi:hypothetical protein
MRRNTSVHRSSWYSATSAAARKPPPLTLVEATLTKQSPVMNYLAKEGKIRIIAAKYDLSDFKVTLMQ